jgi:hypothetical protein
MAYIRPNYRIVDAGELADLCQQLLATQHLLRELANRTPADTEDGYHLYVTRTWRVLEHQPKLFSNYLYGAHR